MSQTPSASGVNHTSPYTAAFPEVVCVLDAFVKKSKSGIKTPQADKDRVRDRFKRRSETMTTTIGSAEERHGESKAREGRAYRD